MAFLARIVEMEISVPVGSMSLAIFFARSMQMLRTGQLGPDSQQAFPL